MPVHPLAGQPAPASMLIDVDRLERAYYSQQPDPGDPTQRVAFGPSVSCETAQNTLAQKPTSKNGNISRRTRSAAKA